MCRLMIVKEYPVTTVAIQSQAMSAITVKIVNATIVRNVLPIVSFAIRQFVWDAVLNVPIASNQYVNAAQ